MTGWHWILTIFFGVTVGQAAHDAYWGCAALILIGVLLRIHEDLVDLYRKGI